MRIKSYLLAGALAALLIAIIPLQANIHFHMMSEGLVEDLVILPGEFINTFIVAGFRGIASDVLWVMADEYWHSGEWYRATPMYRVITWLQPHFIEAWSLGGWHLAYNMYAYTDDPQEKKNFLEAGLRFLKEGLSQNLNKYNLFFELGWTYFHKAEIYDEGIKYFRKSTRFRDHPDYIDRLIAHAYRQKGDIQAEYDEWVRLQNVFPDHESHQKLVRDHLFKAEEKLELLRRAKEIKNVRRKTFYLIDSEWIDSEYQKKMKVISVKSGTSAYDELISLRPQWKEYFEIGKSVLYCPNDLAIRVGPEGKEVLAPEDIDEIKKHS